MRLFLDDFFREFLRHCVVRILARACDVTEYLNIRGKCQAFVLACELYLKHAASRPIGVNVNFDRMSPVEENVAGLGEATNDGMRGEQGFVFLCCKLVLLLNDTHFGDARFLRFGKGGLLLVGAPSHAVSHTILRSEINLRDFARLVTLLRA